MHFATPRPQCILVTYGREASMRSGRHLPFVRTRLPSHAHSSCRFLPLLLSFLPRSPPNLEPVFLRPIVTMVQFLVVTSAVALFAARALAAAPTISSPNVYQVGEPSAVLFSLRGNRLEWHRSDSRLPLTRSTPRTRSPLSSCFHSARRRRLIK